jgi:hypothetical protein
MKMPVPYYCRRYNGKKNRYELNPFDQKRTKIILSCMVISRREEIKNLRIEGNLSVKNKADFASECESLHLTFRPDFGDMYFIKKYFPNLKKIFVPRSVVESLSKSTLKLLELDGIGLETASVNGFRSDRYFKCEIETYA